MSEFQTPLIFDDSFDSSYLEEGHFGGQYPGSLLAHSGALMSMSTYEKPPPAALLDFHNNTGLDEGGNFTAYAPPSFAPHLIYSSGIPPAVHDSDFHYVTSPEFAPQYGFDGQRPFMIDPRTRQAPEIISFTREGSQGTILTVCICTPHDLLAQPAVSFVLQLGSKRVDASIQPLGNPNGPVQQYVIAAEVPPFTQTQHFTFTVPLKLIMDVRDEQSIVPRETEVGHFTYTHQGTQASPARKRKMSEISEYDLQPPAKKVAARCHSSDPFDQTSPYSSFLTTPTNGTTYNMTHQRSSSPRVNGHQYSTSTASQVSLTAPSPHTPAWSPSFSTVKTENSPQPPMTPVPRPASTSSTLKASVPKLVRTSTIQTSPVGVSSAAVASAVTQAFNPYAMYPLKATLKLNGDLDAMAKDWAQEEFDARRRLVQFTRSQVQSTINADFKTIAPEDRPPNSITISCIWWKERKECFVTSVDTIFLLEALVGVRFTVEEKNRIRRNLEGFRPLTVSKSKADSEDFFKVIMGFPNPKPRNIEKDVKVFPWKILSLALKKIISKYSASYSSTASAILTPASSAYASTESSAECHCANSPHAELMDPMANYPINNAAGFPSGIPQGRVTAPVSAASMADLRAQVTNMGTPYNMPVSYGYPHMTQMHQMPQAQHYNPQTMSAPISRIPTSWDFATFVNENPTSMAPASAQPTHYSRGVMDSADFVTPASYATSSR